MTSVNINMKRYWLILLPIVIIAVGQTLAKLGIQHLQAHKQILNVFIISGYCLLILRGLTWIWVIRNVKLSLAYPFISITYVFILLISHYLFNEPLTTRQLLGALLVVGGIFCVGYGGLKNRKGG